MHSFTIRPTTTADRPWVEKLMKEWWNGPEIVSRGVLHRADELPAFIAEKDGKQVGLATYRIDGDECEVISFNSVEENAGIGTALLQTVAETARNAGCRRLWLITTNDNTAALRFYQKRGMQLVALHRNAIEKSRKLKPQIPLIGNDGIPVRDELELVMRL